MHEQGKSGFAVGMGPAWSRSRLQPARLPSPGRHPTPSGTGVCAAALGSGFPHSALFLLWSSGGKHQPGIFSPKIQPKWRQGTFRRSVGPALLRPCEAHQEDLWDEWGPRGQRQA